MSFNGSAGGSQSSRMAYEFGRTHVVRPKGQHQATIVWLHGLGDKGSSWSQLLDSLPLPNIKWICPTAPTRPVSLFGGFPCTACKIFTCTTHDFVYPCKLKWCCRASSANSASESIPSQGIELRNYLPFSGFDTQDISDDVPDDIQGLDASAAHVANLLSTEPADIKIGVGGFSMGAATALYSATCHGFGQYGNRNPYLINLSSIIGLSGWLPCSRTLGNRMEASNETIRRATSLPILLCHGTGDDVVAYKHGEKSASTLNSAGFQNLTFRTYEGHGHYTIPEEMDEVCRWLTVTLGLQGT